MKLKNMIIIFLILIIVVVTLTAMWLASLRDDNSRDYYVNGIKYHCEYDKNGNLINVNEVIKK